jgi:hypothetical protein
VKWLVEMTRDKLHRLCRLLAYIALINFGLFVVIAALIGGDAINGKIEGGHYYVVTHGEYAEVPRIVFIYSYIHALSLLITFPAAAIAGLIDLIVRKKKLMRR